MDDPLELALLGLQRKLRDGLPDKIAQVNATEIVQADGITIDDPVQVLDRVPPLEVQERWPIVCLQQLPSRFVNDTGHESEGKHTVLIVVFDSDDSDDRLARRCRRLISAVRRCVMTDRTIPHPLDPDTRDVVAYGVLASMIEPGPMLANIPAEGRPPEGYITWTGFEVRFTTDDIE